MLVGLAILVPLALIVDGLPSGDEQWRAAAFAAASGVLEFLGLGALLKGPRPATSRWSRRWGRWPAASPP